MPTLRQRLRHSFAPARFEGTMGRWGLVSMALLWTPTGFFMTLFGGWGPHTVLLFAGPVAGVMAVWALRRAWRAGLL